MRYGQLFLISSLLFFNSLAFAGPSDGPANILVTHQQVMHEYTADGVLVRSVSIPENGAGETARDLAVLPDGRIAVYNGAFAPVLSLYDGENWSSQTFDGWSTVNNGTYGGIAVVGQERVLLTDMRTGGAGGAKGLVSFDPDSGSFQRIRDENGYIDVNVGADGLIYALRNMYGALDVIDPQTHQTLTTLDLGHTSSSRAVAADATGNIYMASWDGYIARYTANGTLQDTLYVGNDLYDVDLDADRILVGDRYGNVHVTSTALDTFTSFNVGSHGVFVTSAGSRDTPKPPAEPTYCEAAGQIQTYEWIDSVVRHGLAIDSGPNGGYADHTNQVMVVHPGTNLAMEFHPGHRYSSYNEHWRAWVDFDRDGEFTAEEIIVDTTSRGTVAATLDVPTDQTPGRLRMRVAMQWGSAPAPCGTFRYGEVEDFAFDVLK